MLYQSDRAGHLSVSLILWGLHCSCSPDFRLSPALLLNLRMRMAAAHSRRGHDRPWWINSVPSLLPLNPHIYLKPPCTSCQHAGALPHPSKDG